MKKNEDRKTAEQIFLDERGRITNKELAEQLVVHPATVARWRKLDEWDLKLVREVTEQSVASDQEEEDLYSDDLRQLRALNERIESYLRKQELLPDEILKLAQAKLHIMNCMEIINDQMRYPFEPEYLGEDSYD